MMIPSVIVINIHAGMCLIFTGGCNSSTIQPTVANPQANLTLSVNVWLHTCVIVSYCHPNRFVITTLPQYPSFN